MYMKDNKRKRGREKIGEQKIKGKRRRKKGPYVGIESTTSYSAAHVTTTGAVKMHVHVLLTINFMT